MKKAIQNAEYAAVVLLLILIAACSRENTVTPPVNNPIPKIKTYGYNSTLFSYEYDAGGRASKLNVNGAPQSTYVYATGAVTENVYLANGTLQESHQITLNAEGLAINYVNSAFPSTIIKYEYNPDKTVAKQMNYNNVTLSAYTKFTYSNGNLLSDSNFTNNNVLNYNRQYEYYTDKVSTIENLNRGTGYWGIGSKNVLKKITYFTNGVVQTYQEFLNIEMDASSRITKRSFIQDGTGTPLVFTYTYY